MSTSTHSTQLPAISQRLREERLSRGWSLEDAANRIGASVAVVNQLESDATTHLAGIYRDAYLKRYLRALDMTDVDVDESVAPALRVVLPMPKRHRRLERSIGWARYALASLIIVPPLVWFSIHHSTSWIVDGLGGQSDTKTAQATSASVRHLQASQIPMRPLSESAPEGPSQDQSGTERSAGGDQAMLVVPEALVNVLKVHLSEDSWVELRDAEGNRLEHNLLRADREYTYEGEPPFEVFVGLGSAVSFELNGQPVDHLDSAQREGLMAFHIDASGQVRSKQ